LYIEVVVLLEFVVGPGTSGALVVEEPFAGGMSEPAVPGPLEEAAGCEGCAAFAGGNVLCCAAAAITNAIARIDRMRALRVIASFISS
jgi:hypothetical protein